MVAKAVAVFLHSAILLFNLAVLAPYTYFSLQKYREARKLPMIAKRRPELVIALLSLALFYVTSQRPLSFFVYAYAPSLSLSF